MIAIVALISAAIGVTIGWALSNRRARTRVDAVRPRDEREPGHVAALLDACPVAVIGADATGTITYRNDAARWPNITHVGVLIDDAVERRLAAAVDGRLTRETVELYGPPRRVVEIAAVRVRPDLRAAYVHDVTEVRQTERMRTDFLANVSHELRTPIGAVSLLADALIGEDDPATTRRLADRIIHEVERARATIDDLLDLSRIESGQRDAMIPVDVLAVVRAGIARAEQLAGQRKITIDLCERALDSAHPARIFGNHNQLISAVGNLVENAVKYSHPGARVTVTASVSGTTWEIAVADDGIGIPSRDLDRIFERFYRVDRARSRSTGGSGLGLSIVRHVAANHGGHVTVTSIEGKGSTFVLSVPVAPHLAGTGDRRKDCA